MRFRRRRIWARPTRRCCWSALAAMRVWRIRSTAGVRGAAEIGQRQTRVLEIELLDAASYRSASRTTFRTAEGPFANLALWKNGRADALQGSKVGRLCRVKPVLSPARVARVSTTPQRSALGARHHVRDGRKQSFQRGGLLTGSAARLVITAAVHWHCCRGALRIAHLSLEPPASRAHCVWQH